MKVIAELKKRKVPIVRVDKSLNEYDDKILFPAKLAKANEMLQKVGLPKQWTANGQMDVSKTNKPSGASS